MARYFLLVILTAYLSCVSAADPLPTCVGDTIPICQDGSGRVHIYAPITVHGTLNYFGTDASDTVKLSSQSPGYGAVIVCADRTLSDFRPCQIRGQTIELRYRIPDASDPSGYSTLHALGLGLGGDGNITIPNSILLGKSLDFSGSAYAYFIGNAAHGYRWNDAADMNNLSILDDAGRWQWNKYGAAPNYTSGQRMLTVDSAGRIYTGPVVP